MKRVLKLQFKLSLLCMALAGTFALCQGSAQAQELSVNGSTYSTTFSNGSNRLGPFTFNGKSFGGTTQNGVLELIQSNNLGTINFTPGGYLEGGNITIRVSFSLPSGFSTNPVTSFGSLYAGGSFASINFEGPKAVTFYGPNGSGLFYFQVDDVYFGEGCGEGCIGAGRSPKRPTVVARRDGSVNWLKAKGTASMIAATLPAINLSGQQPQSFTITLTAKISLNPADFGLDPTTNPRGYVNIPPGSGCTRGQGYYKNHANSIPDAADFRLGLGNNNYTKSELFRIYFTPVKGNGLISLAHQLITAKLNAGGGPVPSQIRDAIVSADTLIGSRQVPPIGNGSLPTSQTSALIDLLTKYNEGKIAGAPACQ